MLALLIGAGVIAVVLVCGLVLAAMSALHPGRHAVTRSTRGATTTGTASTGNDAPSDGSRVTTDPRDVLAAKPMPRVDEAASHPGPISPANPGMLTIPAATSTGPAMVPTGFPHTPAGALAQLAAIDQRAVQSGSLAGARTVVDGWALPGGPSETSWSVIGGLAQLFAQLGLSGGGSNQLAIVLTPLMGRIKGSIGTDFVIPCVDFELDLTLTQTARGATADCQRMLWHPDRTVPGVGSRWMLGPGTEPATPPSVWPDTELAIAVGYRDLRSER
jgi:hypothetical protein